MSHLIQLSQPHTNKAVIVYVWTCRRTRGGRLWEKDLARIYSQTSSSKAARWKTSRVRWIASTPINKIKITLSLWNDILQMPLTPSTHIRPGKRAHQRRVAGPRWKHTPELGTFNSKRQQEGMRRQREALIRIGHSINVAGLNDFRLRPRMGDPEFQLSPRDGRKR